VIIQALLGFFLGLRLGFAFFACAPARPASSVIVSSPAVSFAVRFMVYSFAWRGICLTAFFVVFIT
jgi:hypothetical protein